MLGISLMHHIASVVKILSILCPVSHITSHSKVLDSLYCITCTQFSKWKMSGKCTMRLHVGVTVSVTQLVITLYNTHIPCSISIKIITHNMSCLCRAIYICWLMCYNVDVHSVRYESHRMCISDISIQQQFWHEHTF